ncbi:IS3 family transposase [Apilactobacillus kunkeei]|uniref:IS3 family transposase n=1 Tax=Apilactobacillus kunkeei TaxID=148814 RepID=UPI003C7BBEE1
MESFFNQLKVSTVHNNNFKDYNFLNQAVKEYISYYNNYRIKQKLEGMLPVEYRINSSQKIA